MMRAASALMVATLLTTSVISGTFAKYTTKAVGNDQARVATWGFTQTTIEFSDLFKNVYDTTVGSTADVIAPGTTGRDTFSFTYAGQEGAPEVAYTFEVSTEGSACAANIMNNPNILWKLDDGKWGTWDQLITAIEALDGNIAENDSQPANYYAPGTLPTAFNQKGANEHTVEWKWVFDENASNRETATQNNDAGDTAMGNERILGHVNLLITITATQID
ncbi:hypothetical protein ACTQ07_10740 [Holdemanella porci]|uniref:hypothetical protein n=1 Tax=Holdemanella porci TaxID=2652276 RepID=UPI003F928A6F